MPAVGGRRKGKMQLRVPFVERIWRVNSSLTLDEPLEAHEVFEKLDPLFQEQGTQYSVEGDTLTYVKENPNAQDRLATFTSGTLRAEQTASGTRLSFSVASTALFLCFLAPLFFLAVGQFAYMINELEKPGLIEKQAELEAEKEEWEAKKEIEYHWIDQLLGASKQQRSDEDEETKERREGAAREGEEEEDEVEGNHSPETAYVFAGIFFVIFLVGRVLEPYLLKRTFKAHLRRQEEPELIEENNEMQAGVSLAAESGGNTKT